MCYQSSEIGIKVEDQDAFSKVAGKWSDHEYILNGKLTGYADRPNEKCG